MRKRDAELRVRVDAGVRAALRRIAEEEGRTVSELVREAVAEWLRGRAAVEAANECESAEKTGL